MTTPKRRRRLSVPDFIGMKTDGRKISMLTAYDFTFASWLDAAEVDVVLVGDSLGMVVQGHETTIPVTLDEMIYHGKMVCRAVQQAMVIVDIPFPINHQGVDQTVAAAGRILKETMCTAVKLEGGSEQAQVISRLVAAGIPVMAHTGLRPQSVHTLGGYKVQRDEEQLLADALAAQSAGAFGIVLECIPADIARKVSEKLEIPTIGIGAGPDCDGQVLVLHDLLGLTVGRTPKFAKQMLNLGDQIKAAVGQWNQEVRSGNFPTSAQSF